MLLHSTSLQSFPVPAGEKHPTSWCCFHCTLLSSEWWTMWICGQCFYTLWKSIETPSCKTTKYTKGWVLCKPLQNFFAFVNHFMDQPGPTVENKTFTVRLNSLFAFFCYSPPSFFAHVVELHIMFELTSSFVIKKVHPLSCCHQHIPSLMPYNLLPFEVQSWNGERHQDRRPEQQKNKSHNFISLLCNHFLASLVDVHYKLLHKHFPRRFPLFFLHNNNGKCLGNMELQSEAGLHIFP